MSHATRLMTCAIVALAMLASPALAQEAEDPDADGIREDGTIIVRGFDLPPSAYLSPEAVASLPRTPTDQAQPLDQALQAGRAREMRAMIPQFMEPRLEALRQMYRVRTETGSIAGIDAVWIEPEGGVPEANRSKILLNLPGGGFVMGHAGGTGSVESIPLSGLAGVRIVSITYRQFPEHTFPAASEDVAAAYRELLEDYAPEDIGIFGCSAGGMLAAQAIPWLVEHDLPLPGALGIFCASADAEWNGDSRYFDRPFSGLSDAPLEERYYTGQDRSQLLASPANYPHMLAQFPPTLLVTGTRAGELSSAVNTHKELLLAGADAQIAIWDGLGHAFFYDPALPESREAFTLMARFFGENLGLELPQE